VTESSSGHQFESPAQTSGAFSFPESERPPDRRRPGYCPWWSPLSRIAGEGRGRGRAYQAATPPTPWPTTTRPSCVAACRTTSPTISAVTADSVQPRCPCPVL